jgi:hypothetical protein
MSRLEKFWGLNRTLNSVLPTGPARHARGAGGLRNPDIGGPGLEATMLFSQSRVTFA